jgi:uncharacterized membrane protein YcaP (DUF421 family)
MDPLRIAVRALAAYLFLLAGTRLSGKRTLAQVTVVQFVLALVIGDMVDDLLWAEVPAATFVAATGTLIALDVVGDLLSSRFPPLGVVLGEAPVLLLEGGRKIASAARRERLNDGEIEMLLRQQGIGRESWSDVKEAWIDGAGQPAVVLNDDAQPLDGMALKDR